MMRRTANRQSSESMWELECAYPVTVINDADAAGLAEMHFKTRAELVAAVMYNQAGIVGAALTAGTAYRG